MNRQPKHWVLVADSGQARILELQRKPYEFRQVSELASASQHQTTHEIMSDASGRSFHVQGPGSHVKLPRSDPKDQAEKAFVESLAGTLDKAVRLGAFDDLVLIADPRTMGRLRRDISKAVAARVTQEHTLDLVGMPLNKLEPRIRAVLGWKH